MIWPLYAILQFCFTLLCYLTNPIVVLFCDENGELPSIFRMWQTWDDSCNPRFYILEKVPGFLKYDYDRHYREYQATTPDLEKVNRTRWFAEVVDPNFTFKEKVQRYICRVMWLYRNCAYGFAFWCFGRMIDGKNMKYTKNEEFIKFGYDTSRNILTRPWTYKNSSKFFGDRLEWNIYIGWKIDDGLDSTQQCMIAMRIFSIKFL